MNHRQIQNQRVLKNLLYEPKLIKTIRVKTGYTIDTETLDWNDYWINCEPLTDNLAKLKASWLHLIRSSYKSTCHEFVEAYFSLLKSCLFRFFCDDLDLHVLKKVIGFETFHIEDEKGYSVAGMFNIRNPAYLLNKIPQPHALDDPKFLPLVCPFSDLHSRLFYHYRRIPVVAVKNVQLFVYPPGDSASQSSSHSLISRLFKALTSKSDPWVKERINVLYDCVFDKMIRNTKADQIQLLDVGCGSGQVTVGLCKKAFYRQRKNFRVTLIDVTERNKALAKVFYRNPLIFRELIFRQEDLIGWLDGCSNEPSFCYDVALMLRVLDLFSYFHIEPVSWNEIRTPLKRKDRSIPVSNDVEDPAKLIRRGIYHEIHHSIKKIKLKQGSMFCQFSLSDYFKAMSKIMGNDVDKESNNTYAPIRRFNKKALVLPSGRSLIAQLLTLANCLLIEDGDVASNFLRDHIHDFGLNHLHVVNVGNRTRMQSASISLVEKNGS